MNRSLSTRTSIPCRASYTLVKFVILLIFLYNANNILQPTEANADTNNDSSLNLSPSNGVPDGSVSYTVYDDASWAVWDSELSNDILGSNRQELYNDFISKCKLAAGEGMAEQICGSDERFRMQMNMYQPRSVYNFTKLGFTKMRAPDSLMELILEFWENNKHQQQTEWSTVSPFHNTWDTDPTIVALENTNLVGGGYYLRAKIANFIRDAIEDWTGMQQAISSIYGIRAYHNGSILTPHVDRLPLVSSAILNVAQDVDEDWPLEVYDHSGVAHNVTMKPGDLVLYESHSIIHGRPFPLKGNFYANIFVHFEPIGRLNKATDNGDGIIEDDTFGEGVIVDGFKYPPYLIPGTSWDPEWRGRYPNGWNVLGDANRLFVDGDLKTIRYAARKNPSLVHGSEEWKPIHEAVRHGHREIVEYLLLEQNVSIHSMCRAYHERTPLDTAREFLGEQHAITLLIRKLHEEEEAQRQSNQVDSQQDHHIPDDETYGDEPQDTNTNENEDSDPEL